MANLVDTNVLLRSADPNHTMYNDATNAISILRNQGETLCIVPQNLIEFWNVYTPVQPIKMGWGILPKKPGKKSDDSLSKLRITGGTADNHGNCLSPQRTERDLRGILDQSMYDELKILPLTWWTSNYKFRDHLRTLKDPTIGPAIKAMYDDLVKERGVIWLYTSIFSVLPQLLPELIWMWFQSRQREHFVPFLDFEPLLDRSLLEIRQEFDLLPFIQ